MSNVTTRDDESAAALERLTEALSGPPGGVRIEFGIALGAAGSMPTATVHVKNARGRWERVKPFITPEEGGGRAELLRSLAAMIDPEGP